MTTAACAPGYGCAEALFVLGLDRAFRAVYTRGTGSGRFEPWRRDAGDHIDAPPPSMARDRTLASQGFGDGAVYVKKLGANADSPVAGLGRRALTAARR